VIAVVLFGPMSVSSSQVNNDGHESPIPHLVVSLCH
jgi:hypothetical protein